MKHALNTKTTSPFPNQSKVLIAEGEKQSVLLQADAAKQARILQAEGEATAILKVQQAMADSLKLLNEAAPNDQVIKLKALEALEKVALFFPQHLLVQPVAELLFTLPLLLLFIRFLAPSMRQLSHYPASVQCQFGIVPLVGYLFDYITHVYTSLLSEANPAAVEFMFFVCCAASLSCSACDFFR